MIKIIAGSGRGRRGARCEPFDSDQGVTSLHQKFDLFSPVMSNPFRVSAKRQSINLSLRATERRMDSSCRKRATVRQRALQQLRSTATMADEHATKPHHGRADAPGPYHARETNPTAVGARIAQLLQSASAMFTSLPCSLTGALGAVPLIIEACDDVCHWLLVTAPAPGTPCGTDATREIVADGIVRSGAFASLATMGDRLVHLATAQADDGAHILLLESLCRVVVAVRLVFLSANPASTRAQAGDVVTWLSRLPCRHPEPQLSRRMASSEFGAPGNVEESGEADGGPSQHLCLGSTVAKSLGYLLGESWVRLQVLGSNDGNDAAAARRADLAVSPINAACQAIIDLATAFLGDVPLSPEAFVGRRCVAVGQRRLGAMLLAILCETVHPGSEAQDRCIQMCCRVIDRVCVYGDASGDRSLTTAWAHAAVAVGRSDRMVDHQPSLRHHQLTDAYDICDAVYYCSEALSSFLLPNAQPATGTIELLCHAVPWRTLLCLILGIDIWSVADDAAATTIPGLVAELAYADDGLCESLVRLLIAYPHDEATLLNRDVGILITLDGSVEAADFGALIRKTVQHLLRRSVCRLEGMRLASRFPNAVARVDFLYGSIRPYMAMDSAGDRRVRCEALRCALNVCRAGFTEAVLEACGDLDDMLLEATAENRGNDIAETADGFRRQRDHVPRRSSPGDGDDPDATWCGPSLDDEAVDLLEGIIECTLRGTGEGGTMNFDPSNTTSADGVPFHAWDFS